MPDGHHLSLSLSRELWSDLLKAALPVRIGQGRFDLARNTRGLVRQLGVRERVAGLLEDRRPPEAVRRVGERARALWHRRRESVYKRLDEVIRLEGTWKFELDDLGTQLTYSHQRVGAEAFLKGTAEGTLFLLRENVEIPFELQRRVGVSMALGDIGFDRGHQAVVGSLQDLGLHVGDHAVLQLLGRLGEYLLEQQLPRVNPLPILRREQVDEMVGGLGGALRMKMGVDELDLEVTPDDLTLRVRFGFTQLQLTEREEAGA